MNAGYDEMVFIDEKACNRLAKAMVLLCRNVCDCGARDKAKTDLERSRRASHHPSCQYVKCHREVFGE
jgi:hypothetical protein